MNPFISFIEQTKDKPVIIIAQDYSKSVKDYNIIDKLKDISANISGFNVHYLSFSDVVHDSLSHQFNGIRTDINNLFSEINIRFSNQNVAAVVLATDGVYNHGLNPLYNKTINYPVYPIALGDTMVKKDVSIMKIYNNDISFLGNKFPLEVLIQATGCTGDKTELSVWHKNKKIYSEEINIDSDNYYTKKQISIVSTDLGVHEYEVKLSSVLGEISKKNNISPLYIEIVESSYNILILSDAPHPDISAYKNVIKQQKYYHVDHYNSSVSDINLNKYNLVVLFGVQDIDLLGRIKELSVPILVFNFNTLENSILLSDDLVFSRKGDYEEVSAIIADDFYKFNFSDDFIDFISMSPPLYTYSGSYKISANMQFVLKQKILGNTLDKPIIIIQENIDSKVAFICAEGFWRWKLYDYKNNLNSDAFNMLFTKLTQFLVLNDSLDRFKLKYNKSFLVSEDICFDAFFYNELYEMSNEKDIILNINDQDDIYEFSFYKKEKSYSLNAGKLPAGKYSFLARVVGTNFVKKGNIYINPVELEELDFTANHNLLFSLAQNTNGKLFDVNNIHELIKEVGSINNSSIIYTKEKQIGIVNIPWILVSLLSLISLEWFLRRYNGLV